MKEIKKEDVYLGNDHCPVCEKLLDSAASDFTENKPVPEDLTICIHCGAMLKYASDMALEPLTVREFNQLEDENRKQLLETQYKIMTFNGTIDNS